MPVLRDAEGFLVDLNDWNETLAQSIANDEGLSLTPAHWELIYLVRDFYRDYELSPAMRALVKYAQVRLGGDKGKSLYFLSLFPGSPAKLLAKVAGLPKPPNCL